MAKRHDAVRTELVAVVVAVAEGAPRVLTTSGYPLQLPAGPLRDSHRSMQAGLRAWVEDQTGLRLGYVEQLYTFADRDRARDGSERMISVSYLALAWPTDVDVERWVSWYDLFPWEDQRGDGAAVATLVPHLRAWAGEEDTERREVRCRVTFALDGRDWLPNSPSSGTRCCTRRGWCGSHRTGAACWARRSPGRGCCTTTAASWPPASAGCAPRSSTGRWCSS